MRSQPDEVAAGLWRWTARHPDWHPGEFGRRVAAFALRTEDETLLVVYSYDQFDDPGLAHAFA